MKRILFRDAEKLARSALLMNCLINSNTLLVIPVEQHENIKVSCTLTIKKHFGTSYSPANQTK